MSQARHPPPVPVWVGWVAPGLACRELDGFEGARFCLFFGQGHEGFDGGVVERGRVAEVEHLQVGGSPAEVAHHIVGDAAQPGQTKHLEAQPLAAFQRRGSVAADTVAVEPIALARVERDKIPAVD